MLQQLSQRQCNQLSIQDLNEQLAVESSYTKSMLQILREKNLIQKKIQYSCPECHCQTMFVCDGFKQKIQCCQCKCVFDPIKVEEEGIPFYNIPKENFIQYVKEEYPDIANDVLQNAKEIIPFRPNFVEEKKEYFASKPTEEHNQQRSEENNFDNRIAILERDKREKILFREIAKIVIFSLISVGATFLVAYELIQLFVLKSSNVLIYNMYIKAIQNTPFESAAENGDAIDIISTIVSVVVSIIDVGCVKFIRGCYNKIKAVKMR